MMATLNNSQPDISTALTEKHKILQQRLGFGGGLNKTYRQSNCFATLGRLTLEVTFVLMFMQFTQTISQVA